MNSSNKKYFAILDGQKVCHIVDCDKNIDADLKDIPKVLQMMFPENLVEEIDLEKTSLPKFENSYFINGKFYPPKPYQSWVIENDNWVAPNSYPNDNKLYFWNENKVQWQQYLEKIV